MAAIDDIIAAAKLPERVVPLCLRGDLQAEWERLRADLEAARAADGDSLAGDPRIGPLGTQMDDIAAQMRDHITNFRLSAISSRAYSDLAAKHRLPDEDQTDGQTTDMTTWPIALIAACAVDPVMNEDQAGRLWDVISNGQADELLTAALMLNKGTISVPFFVNASARSRVSEPSSKPPEPGASPEADSSEPPPAE